MSCRTRARAVTSRSVSLPMAAGTRSADDGHRIDETHELARSLARDAADGHERHPGGRSRVRWPRGGPRRRRRDPGSPSCRVSKTGPNATYAGRAASAASSCSIVCVETPTPRRGAMRRTRSMGMSVCPTCTRSHPARTARSGRSFATRGTPARWHIGASSRRSASVSRDGRVLGAKLERRGAHARERPRAKATGSRRRAASVPTSTMAYRPRIVTAPRTRAVRARVNAIRLSPDKG